MDVAYALLIHNANYSTLKRDIHKNLLKNANVPVTNSPVHVQNW